MKKTFLFISLLLIQQLVYSQAGFKGNASTGDAFFRKVIPPSPTAASLGQFGNQQANLFTGAASVNIPIYQLTFNGYSLPISLSYNSSGLKVTEAASWVGLGWSLNGMGVITRVVKGSADFTGLKDYFNLRTFPLPLSYSTASASAYNYLLQNLDNNNFDSEPDLYMVNAGKLSIKFYYDRYKRIQTMPYNNSVRIKYDNSTEQYIITDEEGNTYYFGGSQAIETTSQSGVNPYVSSWYLAKISISKGGEINFNYTKPTGSITQDQFYESEEVKQIGSTGDCSTPTASGNTRQFSSQEISLSYLNSIETENEIVYLNRDINQREDMPYDYALKDIKVYQKYAAKYIKTFSFAYSYFPQVSQTCWGQQNGFPAHPHSLTAICKRLRLDGFTEKGGDGSGTEAKNYQFVYSTKPVPARCSLDQDHWGYYNGANNTTLLPAVSNPNFQSSPNAQSREANANYGDAGLLQKIIYPTGGETNFTYEPNQATSIIYQNWQTTAVNLSGINPAYEASATFTLSTAGMVIIKYTLSDADLVDQGLQRKVEILDQNGAVQFFCFNQNSPTEGVIAKTTGVFPAGTYTLKISRNYVYSSYPSVSPKSITASVDYNPPTGSSYVTRTIGGFRVTKIADKTSSSSAEINVKEYVYENPFLIANIVADSYIAQYKRGFTNATTNYIYECPFLSRNSSSVQPIGSVQGSHIAYAKVTTLHGASGSNGKTISYFSVEPDLGGYNLSPIARPIVSSDYRRGQLLQQVDYNSAGQVLKITSNDYEYILKYDGNFSFPYYTRNITIPPGYTMMPDGYPYKQAAFMDFSIPSVWVRLKNTCQTEYSGTNYLSNVQEFSYSNLDHMYVTTSKTKNSKNETVEENKKYPIDYKPTATQSVEQIERKFETDYQTIFNNFYACVNSASNTTALDACYSNYQAAYDNLVSTRSSALSNYSNTFVSLANATSDPVLKAKYLLVAKNRLAELNERTIVKNGSTPLSKEAYDYADYNGSVLLNKVKRAVLTNPLETELTVDAYDNRGNVLQAISKDGIYKSYIWGYNKSYPVAQVINAKSNEIMFDSFEEGGWDGYLTAYDAARKHSGKLSGRIDKPTAGEQVCMRTSWLNVSLSAPTKFKYSGWFYSTASSAEIFLFMKTSSETGYYTYVTSVGNAITNQWVYLEGEYTVPANITQLNIRIDNNGGGTVWFDDIRLHPSSAQMNTYAYDPLVGLTSQSDINNNISYFRYDALGRLSYVQDKDFNVIKRYCYNYAGQQESCTINLTPQWVSTGNYRCVKDGSNNNTGAQEREEKDTNPTSESYGGIRWVSNGANTASCPLPNQVTVSGTSSIGQPYNVRFTNTSTNVQYSTIINGGSNASINMPAGTYNVLFYPSGTPINALFTVSGGFSYYGTGASFSNVSVNAQTYFQISN